MDGVERAESKLELKTLMSIVTRRARIIVFDLVTKEYYFDDEHEFTVDRLNDTPAVGDSIVGYLCACNDSLIIGVTKS